MEEKGSDMLQLFSVDFYDLLNPCSTFSFVTPLIPTNFDILPDVLN